MNATQRAAIEHFIEAAEEELYYVQHMHVDSAATPERQAEECARIDREIAFQEQRLRDLRERLEPMTTWDKSLVEHEAEFNEKRGTA